MIELSADRSEHGVVTIFKSRSRATHLYMHGDTFQSEADANGISVASYVHAIYGLVHQTTAVEVLVIGCAGGTLATMLSLGGYRVTAVDINPVAFEFARQYFCLPASVECCVADGFDYLKTTERRFDAIVLDAYCGDQIPAHLVTSEFLHLVHSCMSNDGAFLANVYLLDDSERDEVPLMSVAAAVWSGVRLLDASGEFNRNAILAAGAVQTLVPPCLILAPEHDATGVKADLAKMRF
jgi:spermidine synthase